MTAVPAPDPESGPPARPATGRRRASVPALSIGCLDDVGPARCWWRCPPSPIRRSPARWCSSSTTPTPARWASSSAGPARSRSATCSPAGATSPSIPGSSTSAGRARPTPRCAWRVVLGRGRDRGQRPAPGGRRCLPRRSRRRPGRAARAAHRAAGVRRVRRLVAGSARRRDRRGRLGLRARSARGRAEPGRGPGAVAAGDGPAVRAARGAVDGTRGSRPRTEKVCPGSARGELW